MLLIRSGGGWNWSWCFLLLLFLLFRRRLFLFLILALFVSGRRLRLLGTVVLRRCCRLSLCGR